MFLRDGDCVCDGVVILQLQAEVLDPFRLAEMRDVVPWPQALAGKRVLIVTSMARDIARQYERYRTDGVSWSEWKLTSASGAPDNSRQVISLVRAVKF